VTLSRLLLGACLLFPSTIASAEEHARAPELYERGFSHYKLGEFEAAIVDFKAAYAIEPSNMLLFNIAQSHRQLGDAKRAVFFYRAFVRDAPPSLARTDAERFVAILERDAATRVVAPQSPSPVAAAADVAPSAAPMIVSPRLGFGRRSAVALVASTSALGAVFLASGAGLAVHAAKTADSLEQAPLDTPWDAEHGSRYDEGRASSSASLAFFVVGGVALGTSVVSAIVFREQLARGRARPVDARLTRLSWTF